MNIKNKLKWASITVIMACQFAGITYGTSLDQASSTEAVGKIVSQYRNGDFTNKKLTVSLSKSTDAKTYMQDVLKELDKITGYLYTLNGTLNSGVSSNKLDINLVRNDEEQYKIQAINKAVSLIADKAKVYQSDRAKLQYVNNMLIELAEYDTESANNIYEASDLAWSAYGLLINGKAVCGGYTNTFTLICEQLDIPVIEVTGNLVGKSEKHTWNEVYIEDKWYVVDVTSNDPILYGDGWSSEDLEFIHNQYFLIPEEEAYNSLLVCDQSELALTKDLKYPNLPNHKTQYLQEHKILIGTDRGLELDKSLSRSELAVMICRLTNSVEDVTSNIEYYTSICDKHFTDVKTWAKPYVGYTYSKGILKGYGNKTFGGNNSVTKREYSAVLDRIYKKENADYSDVLEKYIANGVLSETRTPFVSGDIAKRSDIADMTYNILMKH